VSRLGVAEVDERSPRAEVADDLIVRGPGPVLVVEGVAKRPLLGLAQRRGRAVRRRRGPGARGGRSAATAAGAPLWHACLVAQGELLRAVHDRARDQGVAAVDEHARSGDLERVPGRDREPLVLDEPRRPQVHGERAAALDPQDHVQAHGRPASRGRALDAYDLSADGLDGAGIVDALVGAPASSSADSGWVGRALARRGRRGRPRAFPATGRAEAQGGHQRDELAWGRHDGVELQARCPASPRTDARMPRRERTFCGTPACAATTLRSAGDSR
jgi:hypothetical protein